MPTETVLRDDEFVRIVVVTDDQGNIVSRTDQNKATPEQVNAATVDTKLDGALAALQQLIDSPPTTAAGFTAAVKSFAQVLRLLVRAQRRNFQAAD